MSRRLREHPLLLWTFALIVTGAFASLGMWQFGRAQQKRAMLEGVHDVLSARSPQAWAVLGDETRARDYDWVEIQGRFVDAPAVLLDNQQQDGKPGVRAYRVFVAVDGQPVLVDLGWAPVSPDRRMPAVPRQDKTTLTGLLLPPPGKGLTLGPPARQPDGTLLATTLDPIELRATLTQPKLALRVLRPEPEAGFGFQRDFDILPNTLPPERHIGYAVQWFALSAAALITALLLTWRRARRARRDTGHHA